MNEEYYSPNLNNEIKDKQQILSNKIEPLKPLYEFSLEYENGKKQVVNLNPNLKPEEIAYNFCKQNNLDFESLLLIKEKISAAIEIIKKNSQNLSFNQYINNLKINYLNDSICEDSAEQQSLSHEKILKLKNLKNLISNNKNYKMNINNENNSNLNIYKILDQENSNLYHRNSLIKQQVTSSIVANTINNCMEIIEKEEKPLSSEMQESTIVRQSSESNNYISSSYDVINNENEKNFELNEKINKDEEIIYNNNENIDPNKTKKRETSYPESHKIMTKAITYINNRKNKNISNKKCNTLNNNFDNKNYLNNKIRKFNCQYILPNKKVEKKILKKKNIKINKCKEKLMDVSKICDSNNNYSCNKKTIINKRNLSISDNNLTESNTKQNFYTVNSINHEIDFNILSQNKINNSIQDKNMLHKYFSSLENKKHLFSYDKIYRVTKNNISIKNYNLNLKKNDLNKKTLKLSPASFKELPHNNLNSYSSLLFSSNSRPKNSNISNMNIYSPLIIKNYFKKNRNYSKYNVNNINHSKNKFIKMKLTKSDYNINSKSLNKCKNDLIYKIKKDNTYRNIYYNKLAFKNNNSNSSNLSNNHYSNDSIFKEIFRINNSKTKSLNYHSKQRCHSFSNEIGNKSSIDTNPFNKNIIKIKKKKKTIYKFNNKQESKKSKKLNDICEHHKENKIFLNKKKCYFYYDSSFIINNKHKKNLFIINCNSNKNLRMNISPTNFNTVKNINVSTLTNSNNCSRIQNNYYIKKKPLNIKLFYNPKNIKINNINNSSNIINYKIKNKNLSASYNASNKSIKINTSSCLRNSSLLTKSLEEKNKISNSLQTIFLYLSKGNNYLDGFKILKTNKNHSDIYPVIKSIIKSCRLNLRFVYMKEFIEKGKILFEKLSKKEQKIIFDFKKIT